MNEYDNLMRPRGGAPGALSTRHCDECGHILGRNAVRCPHCGQRYSNATTIIITVFIALALGGFLFGRR